MKDINKTEINMDQLEIVTGGFINSCDPSLEVESCDPPLGKTGPSRQDRSPQDLCIILTFTYRESESELE